MPKKNNEELPDAVNETETTGKLSGESNSDAAESDTADTASAAPVEKNDEASAESDQPSVLNSVFETVASAVGTVADTVAGGVSAVVNAVTGNDTVAPDTKEKHSKRAEKIGTVASDKMTKTVVVRVDRVVKHPMYRKYIKRRKKFMAHDELGAAIGDKVKIVETRPLSARKRWRVVEIIQKAER